MRKMRKINLVTAVVVLALASGQAVYATETEVDENSVYNWGPWDKLVSPAIGTDDVDLNQFVFNLPDDYEPEKNAVGIIGTDFVCPAGALCGSGVIEGGWSPSEYGHGEDAATPWEVALILDKNGDPTDTFWSESNFPDAESYSNYSEYLTNTTSWQKVDPNGVINMFGGNLRDGSVQYTGSIPFYYPIDPNFPDEPADDYNYYYIQNVTEIGWEDGIEERFRIRVNLTPVLGEGSGGPYIVTFSETYIDTDVDVTCADGCDGGGYSKYIDGAFIVGTPTDASEIADRNNEGRSVAHYSGHTLFAGKALFEMDVDFGERTWNAAVNGGSDGPVYINSATNHVSGRVGWKASGDIVGATFVSTSVSADDGTVTGFVNGDFFNSNANAVGGVADLTKSRTDGAYIDFKHVVGVVGIEVGMPQ